MDFFELNEICLSQLTYSKFVFDQSAIDDPCTNFWLNVEIYFKNTLNITFLIFTCFILFKEIKSCYKKRKEGKEVENVEEKESEDEEEEEEQEEEEQESESEEEEEEEEVVDYNNIEENNVSFNYIRTYVIVIYIYFFIQRILDPQFFGIFANNILEIIFNNLMFMHVFFRLFYLNRVLGIIAILIIIDSKFFILK
jgi:hypothetical protein